MLNISSITVTIIETIDSNKYVLKCRKCDGSGKGYDGSRLSSKRVCNVCNGRGVVVVLLNENASTPFVECKVCNGTGRIKTSRPKHIIDLEYTMNTCSYCHGTGAQPICGSMKVLK